MGGRPSCLLARPTVLLGFLCGCTAGVGRDQGGDPRNLDFPRGEVPSLSEHAFGGIAIAERVFGGLRRHRLVTDSQSGGWGWHETRAESGFRA